MSNESIRSAESAKVKRKYHRKPAPPPPPAAPLPPSAAIVSLEGQVLELIKMRMPANDAIANAMAAANEANSRLQVAQLRLKQIEHEVQYQLAIVREMKGGLPQQQMSIASPTEVFDQRFYAESGMGVMIPPGVSSIPPQPAPMTVMEGGRRVRSESAEAVRAAV